MRTPRDNWSFAGWKEVFTSKTPFIRTAQTGITLLMTDPEKSPAPQDTVRVAVIGAGVRSVSYLSNVPADLKGRIRLVAVADPSGERRQLLINRFSAWGSPCEYEDGNSLLDEANFDALIIGSYNNTHAEFAIRAIDSGAVILLEKPVATTVQQCAELWRKIQAHDANKVFVGFVLRYTPFFQHLSSLLRGGAVGQLLAIDADENLSQSITSGFFRAWRRDDRLSGGFMVEKCCHDFDIFNFLIGHRVTKVFSIAKRTHFIPRPLSEQHQRFAPDNIRNLALDYADIHTKQIFENTSDESIYGARSDVPDHQAVMLEFEDGTLVNFMACHGQPRATRRIRIFGSNGSLEGDIDRGEILHDIPYENRLGADTRRHTIQFDESGHHGADSVINRAFWQAARGGACHNLAGIKEGLEAVIVGLAVEKSKRTGVPVEVAPLRRAVFECPLETVGIG